MTRKYFGTDGIRGTVGQPPITPDFVLRLAHADWWGAWQWNPLVTVAAVGFLLFNLYAAGVLAAGLPRWRPIRRLSAAQSRGWRMAFGVAALVNWGWLYHHGV